MRDLFCAPRLTFPSTDLAIYGDPPFAPLLPDFAERQAILQQAE